MSEDGSTNREDTVEETGHSWYRLYPEGVPHRLEYGDTTLIDQLEHAVTRWADRPALEFFGRITTYAELDERIDRFAEGLYRIGVRPGDRVAVLLPNCPQNVIAFYAILRLGGVVVEHNPLYTEHELSHPFYDHGAKVVIAWNDIVPMLRHLARTSAIEMIVSVDLVGELPFSKRLLLSLPLGAAKKARAALGTPHRGHMSWEEVERSPRLPVDHPTPKKDDLALILYTSGTTGAPKGAELTHANLVANCAMGRAWVPNLRPGEEIFLAALPMFHAYGVTMTVTFGISTGAKLILLPKPEIDLIMSILRKQTPTFIPAVPPLYQRIAEESRNRGISIRGIRHSFSGAMSLPPELVEEWEAATEGLLVEGYGMTETSPIVIGNPMSLDRRPGSVGIPFPDTVVRICDPEDPSRELPLGEPGEIQVKGPQVFRGYRGLPEQTAEAFHDGWYRTGDVATMDADGFITIVDRIKEIIITGGFNVYPSEVEAVLREHVSVLDAAVVGLPAEGGGEFVAAAIVLEQGARLDTDELREHCRAALARYKVPRMFEVLDELPTNPMGKVLRKDVAAVLASMAADADPDVAGGTEDGGTEDGGTEDGGTDAPVDGTAPGRDPADPQ